MPARRKQGDGLYEAAAKAVQMAQLNIGMTNQMVKVEQSNVDQTNELSCSRHHYLRLPQ